MAPGKHKTKRNATETVEELHDQDFPPKKKRGRPPKVVEEVPETVEDSPPKLTLKLRVPKTTSGSDSDIVLLDDSDSSEHGFNATDDDALGEVEAAAVALIGLGRGTERANKSVEGSEDSEEEDEEDEEEEAPRRKKAKKVKDFELKFLVPVGAATDEITLSSTLSHTEFMRAVGDEMDIRPKDLKIAYRFNFWTQKEPLRLLSTEKHLAGLFVVARKELQERVDKKTKRSKELEVTIADVRDKEEKLKKGKGKEKRKAPPVRKSTHSSDGSDDDDLRPPRKKSGAEFLRELHSKHKCELHSSFCLIAKNGEHIALSDQKMSLWSMLLSEKAHSSITEPPPQLQLSMDNGSHTVPAGRNRRTDNNNQQPSVPFAYYPPPPGYMPPHAYPSYYHPVPPPPPAAPQPSASKPSSSTLHHASSIDSQDDDNITFPKLDDWLRELNAADEDGHQFDSFAPALHANGFMRVYQLADERDGVGLLTKICPEIKIGTASLLVKRAKKECNTLRRLEKQRKIDWAS